MATVPRASNGSRCRGRNRAGQPCGRVAWKDGWCRVHHPLDGQDLREVGKLGGRGRTRSALGINDSVADEKLRGQAKRALEAALNSESEQVRLRAAQSLYSYRSQAPPADERREGDRAWPVTGDGHRATTLADVVTFAAEIGQASPELVAACRLVVDAADAGGARVS